VVGAEPRTIKGAAVDSAPKLAIAEPNRIGLGSGERSELTCCYRPKAVELGHSPDSIAGHPRGQLRTITVSP
jgi:hypothetical protein